MCNNLLPNEILEHRGLSRTLTADDGDLREVELHRDPELRERILELVHDRDQLLHARVARHPGARIARFLLSFDTHTRAPRVLVPFTAALNVELHGQLPQELVDVL